MDEFCIINIKGDFSMKQLRYRSAAVSAAAAVIASGACMLPPLAVQAAGSVVINEVCTKNTKLAASDGGFYDYIELYNPTGSAVSLAGWSLSDDPANPTAYVFPAGTSVPAKGFLTVWCGVPETAEGASFGLSKKGETVLLFDAAGAEVERLSIPALADDTAYARVPDGSETFGILETLSPGAANPQSGNVEVVVRAPEFSAESGFYQSGFDLTISAPAGCTVYYTTDGSDPTAASQKYTAPIAVQDVSNQPNVYSAKTNISIDAYTPPSEPVQKAMIVRAIAVDQSGNVSAIATKSYFVGYTDNDIVKNMRVISLVTDPDNLFDEEKGIYVVGKVHEDWMKSAEYDPRLESYFQPCNYTQSGKEWERPAHITVFESGTAAYSAAVGIRIHGGATRSLAQKSLNLYARADYGTSKMKYDFFGGTLTDVNGKVIDSFDKLTLRNGGNDEKTKIRDRLNHEMLSDRSYGTIAQTECVVFIDGEFWGTYNLMEKIGSEYLSDHYDVKEKDVCMIKTNELADGSEQGWADFEALKEFALSGDANSPVSFAELEALVDPQSFADYMATEMLLANQDFGGNNYALWKTETVDASRPYADGKWRFVLFDTEYGQGLYSQSNANTSIVEKLREQSNKGEWLPRLFLRMMQDSDFRTLFIRNYCDLCNENLKAETVTARLSELIELYRPSMAKTIERFGWNQSAWGGWGWPGQGGGKETGESVFNSNASPITEFWRSRDSSARNLLTQWLGNQMQQQRVTVTLNNDAQQGSVQLNTLTLDCAENGTWRGEYFAGEPILLEAAPKTGSSFLRWEITGAEVTGGSLNSAAVTVVPTQNASAVEIKAVYGEGAADAFTQADVRSLLAFLMTDGKLTAAQAARYDLDGSGTLTAKDLTLLKRKV